MKRVVILGSTGSIGRQTIEVIKQHPDELQIIGLSARKSAEILGRQAEELAVKRVALMDEHTARQARMPGGMEALTELATLPEADIVVVAVAGVIGLVPTVAAIRAGKHVALASKEVLVAAGEMVMPLAKKHNVKLTPIDSEHSAVFQCMQGHTSDQVDKIILTASGGPFRGKTRDDLKDVTAEQALAHPTWRMGGKITVDSATLMNKGLEMIEARWLFDVAIEHVEAVVHPQSIIHSMVKFKDGSVMAQMGWPDMRLPIQYALLHPERLPTGLRSWNPLNTPTLTFEEMDTETFRCPLLARQSLQAGGTMPCAMNAANEEAATGFLTGECKFLHIAEIVEEVMVLHAPGEAHLDHLLETDRWARETARRLMKLR